MKDNIGHSDSRFGSKGGFFRQETALRRGDMVWASGRLPPGFDHPSVLGGRMPAQTRLIIESLERSLAATDAAAKDVVKLHVYYVGQDGWAESIATIGRFFDGALAFTSVMVPRLSEPGQLIQIDAVAAPEVPKESGERMDRLLSVDVPFSQAVKCGDLVYVSGQFSIDEAGETLYREDEVSQTRVVMDRIAEALSPFGASTEDIVRTNAYYMGLRSWKDILQVRAKYSSEGPTSTGIVVPSIGNSDLAIQIDAVASIGPNRRFINPSNHYSFPFGVPFRHGARCGNNVFVAGQVAFDLNGILLHEWDLPRQAKVAMENVAGVLAAFGAKIGDVVRLIVYFIGVDDWRQSMSIQLAFSAIGTPVTSVFVDRRVIPDFGDMIEIEAEAVVD